jgi:hypothetical protein
MIPPRQLLVHRLAYNGATIICETVHSQIIRDLRAMQAVVHPAAGPTDL